MDDKKKVERANRVLDAMVEAFNKQLKGALPMIKKQTAESVMKDKSEAMRKLFMSRIDLS